MPAVTVICPTYNRGEAIVDTLESVRAQEFRDWEMIVVSDASDDDTDEVVARVAEHDARIRPMRTRRFGFQAGPTNIALAQAQGDYVAYIDHDDRWRPHHLTRLVEAFSSGARFAATRSSTFDKRGQTLRTAHPLSMVWHPELQLMSALFENSCAAHHIELSQEVGGWYESAVGLEDWDLWLRFADTGATCITDLEITVDIFEDPSTRQNSLACDYRHEFAVYPDVRSARAGYRALSDLRRWDEAFAACRLDTLAWYRRLDARGELVWPRGWVDGAAHLPDAIVGQLQQVGKDWDMLTIEPVDGGYSLGFPISTMNQQHADRYVEFFRRTMLEQQAFLAKVLGGEPTARANQREAGCLLDPVAARSEQEVSTR